jgi:hypothetical protein
MRRSATAAIHPKAVVRHQEEEASERALVGADVSGGSCPGAVIARCPP